LVTLSCRSWRAPPAGTARSSGAEGKGAFSIDVIEEEGERRDEFIEVDVEVVVLLLERPLKTDNLLGL
jgi:hypothetical protein